MPGVGLAPGSPVAAEDIRNLKHGTASPEAAQALGLFFQACRALRCLNARPSSARSG